MYRIVEYMGNYQVESQLWWHETLKSKSCAKFVAEALYKLNCHHSEDYYVIVEKINPNDPGLGDPVVVYAQGDVLTGHDMEQFLYEIEK